MNFEELLESINQTVHYGIMVHNSILLTILLYGFTFAFAFLLCVSFNSSGSASIKDSISVSFVLSLISTVFIVIAFSTVNYGPISDTKKEAYIQDYLNAEENYKNESIEKYNSEGNQISFTLKDGTYVSLPAKNVKYDVKNDGIPYYSYVEFKKGVKGEKTYKKGKHNETVHLPKNAK